MKRLMQIFLPITILTVCLTLNSHAQKPQVKTRIDTTRILIGDQVNILYELDVAERNHYLFPVFKDTLVKNLEILSVSPIDSQQLNSEITRLTQRILVTSFDTGFYVIPSLYFIDTAANDSLKSEALPLEVLTLEIDTAKGIADIKLPYEVPVTFWEVLPYIVVGLLLAGIMFLLWYLWKRKEKKPAVPIQPKPSEPPHIWALRELDKLAAQKLWQQGKIKLFHSRVSEILRSYIEFRYHIPAMEQITSEIIFALDAIDFPDKDLLENLHQSMEISDLVKFAKWDPLPEENEKAMEMAYEFVYKTKRVSNLRETSDEAEDITKRGGE